MGRNLYPRAPDMTLAATQALSDGELYSIIENGIRLTGMPAWGKGEPGKHDSWDSWALVAFIRHLPRLTPEELTEMKKLNPVSSREMNEAKEEEDFLRGKDEPGKAPQGR